MSARKTNFWFKQVVVWILTLIFSISAVGEAQAKSLTRYEQMSGEEKFTEIKEQVVHSALNLSKYRASDAYEELDKALNRSQRIYSLVQKTQKVDDVIDKVADGLEKIATAYERVADFSSDIASNRREEFANLLLFNNESLKTERQLKNEIIQIEANNRLIQKQLDDISDEFSLKKLRVSLKGNQSIISSLEAQRLIWENFYQTQKKMLDSLILNGREIDLLVHVLKVNAGVYREAANVARLRRSAKDALNSLGYLVDIQGIVVDLENSWSEVNGIVFEISKAEFTLDFE